MYHLPLLFLLITACSAPDPSWDAVTDLEYASRTVNNQILRRMHLLNGGINLKTHELAADSVWRSAAGHTLIARQPEREYGIVRLRVRRLGAFTDEDPVGIGRGLKGSQSLDGPFWIVDIFSSLDDYIGSAAVSRALPTRRLLQHMGIARPLTDAADRMHLDPDEQAYWRELLPEVIRNRGYGRLYLPRQTVEAIQAGTVDPDTLEVKAERYNLTETPDYVLVGRDLAQSGYRHIFTAGHQYLFTLLHYAPQPPTAAQLLEWAGLEIAAADSGSR